MLLEGAHVEHRRLAGCGQLGRVRRLRDPRPAVERDDASGRRRPRRRDRRRDEHELLDVAEPERRVRLALAADRRRPVAAHVAAAERARHVAGVDLDSRRQLCEPRQRGDRGPRRPRARRPRDRDARRRRRTASRPSARCARRPRRSSARAGARACAARGSTPRRPRGRRRPRAAPTRTPARRADAPRRAGRARARAGRARTRGRRACASRARARSGRPPARRRRAARSIANGGSTTTATPASGSPTRYEAQPRSSFTNCRKSSTDRDVNTGRGGRSARCRPDPAVDPREQRDEREQRRDDCDHKRCVRQRASARVLACWSRRR